MPYGHAGVRWNNNERRIATEALGDNKISYVTTGGLDDNKTSHIATEALGYNKTRCAI